MTTFINVKVDSYIEMQNTFKLNILQSTQKTGIEITEYNRKCQKGYLKDKISIAKQ